MVKLYPSLKLFDPRSYWASWIFSIVNIGVGVYFLGHTALLFQTLIWSWILSFKTWGVIFIGMGIVLIYFLYKNNWKVIRSLHLIYFFVKIFWVVALIYISYKVGFYSILASFAIWGGLAALQFVVWFYFVDYRKLSEYGSR